MVLKALRYVYQYSILSIEYSISITKYLVPVLALAPSHPVI